jgi:hypothetical protein
VKCALCLVAQAGSVAQVEAGMLGVSQVAVIGGCVVRHLADTPRDARRCLHAALLAPLLALLMEVSVWPLLH